MRNSIIYCHKKGVALSFDGVFDGVSKIALNLPQEKHIVERLFGACSGHTNQRPSSLQEAAFLSIW